MLFAQLSTALSGQLKILLDDIPAAGRQARSAIVCSKQGIVGLNALWNVALALSGDYPYSKEKLEGGEPLGQGGKELKEAA